VTESAASSAAPPDAHPPLRVTALAGGIGGARFIRGLTQSNVVKEFLAENFPGRALDVTVIANTGDDIWVHGLRVCPDLDTIMYTLGGGISTERGWGRENETFTAKDELAAYGVEPTWFGLGDRDIATHLVRTTSLQSGYSLSEVTQALCTRWQPGITLIPMSDDRCETHVVVDHPETNSRVAIHFQEWWIKYRAELPAHDFVYVGKDQAKPAPGVIEAITNADLVILPPSNPVVSIGTIVNIPGIHEALRNTLAPIVGISPIINGAPVRGMADACLSAINVDTTAAAVAMHYGSRTQLGPEGETSGLIDYWLVDSSDESCVNDIKSAGIHVRAVPLLMSDVETTGEIAKAAMSFALSTQLNAQ
jgi:LPPG:FO 2-phospho-L-lactate transferase